MTSNELVVPSLAGAPEASVPASSPRPVVMDHGYELLERLLTFGAVLFLLPLLLVIAVLVWATSPGPVLFRQVRIGQYGHPFTMLKFRTMRADAEQVLPQLLAEHGIAAGDSYWKLDRDPRITPVGRILRSTSLDELPQLWNVVRGEMRLVGPRPQLPEQVLGYQRDTHWRRLLVKPGITGLWQVSGRSDLDAHTALHLDEQYVRRYSLAQDLWILLRTAAAVVRRTGAR